VARENAAEKGRRLLSEGRLIVQRVEPSGLVVASCRGDSGAVYSLGFDPVATQWRCTCPALTRCSHLTALMLVVAVAAEP
jgi:uncharacterized Zn finger protein